VRDEDKAMKGLPLVALLLMITIVTTGTLIHSNEGLKTYSVKKITGKLELSGKGDDPAWKRAHILTDFHYPWENGAPPPPTRFKALHNAEWIYFFFEVEDPAVFLSVKDNDKYEVAGSSRAEIFFKIDDDLRPYYCLELDPLGRVLDYEGTYHRDFNLNWSWPKDQLLVKTHRASDGYSVEFAISKSSLKKLSLLKDNVLQAGLFRADSFQDADGTRDFKWISWVKPDSKTPDFHIPSSFGLLRLED
jgi:hypothetical protein